MSWAVVLRPEVLDDIEAARTWYERHRVGLGDAFVAEALATFDRIAESPLIYAELWRDVRACQLHRFPYVVYFRVRLDSIEVIAVMHGSRRPTHWRKRFA